MFNSFISNKMTDPFSFAVVGHVDTGKSSLCGNLLVKTGGVSAEEFAAVKRKVCAEGKQYALYSRLLDIYEEEMVKSKTHEWSAFDFVFNERKYKLIDTPGHKEFIRSMIQGLSYAGTAVVVVSAKDGEFEGGFMKSGQTQEDILLCRCSGIQRIVIAVNKMDYCDWNKERFDFICGRLQTWIKNLGFESVVYIPVSGYNGIGLTDHTLLPEWYNGPYLMDAIIRAEVAPTSEVDNSNPFIVSNAVIGAFKIFAPCLIKSGWVGMAHIRDAEIEIEIQTTGIVKQGDKATMTLLFRTPFAVRKEERIILRCGEKTLGQGRIHKVRPINKAEAGKLSNIS